MGPREALACGFCDPRNVWQSSRLRPGKKKVLEQQKRDEVRGMSSGEITVGQDNRIDCGIQGRRRRRGRSRKRRRETREGTRQQVVHRGAALFPFRHR